MLRSRALSLVLVGAAIAACSSRPSDGGAASAVTDVAEDPFQDLKAEKLGSAPAYKGHFEVLDENRALFVGDDAGGCIAGAALATAGDTKAVRDVVPAGAWKSVRVSPDKKWVAALGAPGKACSDNAPDQVVFQSLVDDKTSTYSPIGQAVKMDIDFVGKELLVFEPGTVRGIDPATGQQSWQDSTEASAEHVLIPHAAGLFMYSETGAQFMAEDGNTSNVTGLPPVVTNAPAPSNGNTGTTNSGSSTGGGSTSGGSTPGSASSGTNAGTRMPPNNLPKISALVLPDDSVLVSSLVEGGTYSLHSAALSAVLGNGNNATASSAKEVQTGLLRPAQLSADGAHVLFFTADAKDPKLEVLNVIAHAGTKDAAPMTVKGLGKIDSVFLDAKGRPVGAVGVAADSTDRVFATVTDGTFNVLTKVSAKATDDLYVSAPSKQVFYLTPDEVKGVSVRAFAQDGTAKLLAFEGASRFSVDPSDKPISVVVWNDGKASLVPIDKPTDSRALSFGKVLGWQNGVLFFTDKSGHLSAATSDGFFTKTIDADAAPMGDAALDPSGKKVFTATASGIQRLSVPKYDVGKAKPTDTTTTDKDKDPGGVLTTPKPGTGDSASPPVGAAPGSDGTGDSSEETSPEAKKEKKSVDAGCSVGARGDATSGLLVGIAGALALFVRRRRHQRNA